MQENFGLIFRSLKRDIKTKQNPRKLAHLDTFDLVLVEKTTCIAEKPQKLTLF